MYDVSVNKYNINKMGIDDRTLQENVTRNTMEHHKYFILTLHVCSIVVKTTKTGSNETKTSYTLMGISMTQVYKIKYLVYNSTAYDIPVKILCNFRYFDIKNDYMCMNIITW